MNEILLMKARLAEKKKRFSEMEFRADTYIRTLRDIVDPYAGHFTGFDIEKALVIMRDFFCLWEEARKLQVEILKMECELNG